ncbi:MAG: DUF2924 domain-containing protein [Planctomycetota bacterium]|jgi:hypothetical protein
MTAGIQCRIRELEGLTVGQLRQRYAQLFGEASRSSNRRHLIRRLAWRIQALAEGGLPERARRRAEELVDECAVRLSPPRGSEGSAGEAPAVQAAGLRPRDRRLPAPGTVLVRKYKGRVIQVTVVEDGFLYEGQRYRSLSAVARAITGSRWSGHVFFGLTPRKRRG